MEGGECLSGRCGRGERGYYIIFSWGGGVGGGLIL